MKLPEPDPPVDRLGVDVKRLVALGVMLLGVVTDCGVVTWDPPCPPLFKNKYAARAATPNPPITRTA